MELDKENDNSDRLSIVSSESDISVTSRPQIKISASKFQVEIIKSELAASNCSTCREYRKQLNAYLKTNDEHEIVRLKSKIEIHLEVIHKIKRKTTKNKIATTKNPHTHNNLETMAQPSTIAANQALALTSDEEFTTLKRKNKESPEGQLRQKPKFEIPIRNKFEALSSVNIENTTTNISVEIAEEESAIANKINITDNTQESIKTKATETLRNQQKTNSKNQKPPPIVLTAKLTTNNDFKLLNNIIKNKTQNAYTIRHCKNSTIIDFKEINDYKIFKQHLQNSDTPWYTYSTPEEKTHAFVLKGLEFHPEAQEVQEELQNEHQLDIKNIYKLNTKHNAIYMVITGGEMKLTDIRKITHVFHSSVQWERRISNKEVIQCKNCQMWGHAATNCHRQPRCNNCARPHTTKSCTQKDATNCINCGSEEHRASNTNCPVYQFRTKKIHDNQMKAKRSRYVPAPPPRQNAWNKPTTEKQNQAKEDSPSLNNEKEFPQLPRRELAKKEPAAHINLNSVSQIHGTLSEINEIINLNEFNKMLKDFLTQLKSLPSNASPMDKASIALNFFINDITNYKI